MFSEKLLFQLSKVYGFDKMQDHIVEKLTLSELEEQNVILNIHIWFFFFTLPNSDFVLSIVNRYCLGLGPPNPILKRLKAGTSTGSILVSPSQEQSKLTKNKIQKFLI